MTKWTLCNVKASSPFFKDALASQRVQASLVVPPLNISNPPGAPDHTVATVTPLQNKLDHCIYFIVAPWVRITSRRRCVNFRFLPGNWDKNNLVWSHVNLAQCLRNCFGHSCRDTVIMTFQGVLHELRGLVLCSPDILKLTSFIMSVYWYGRF